ncbi:MAG TPA: hypothetical protein VLZ12_01575 [Verrucomicrobiae bacterium]|nr:hypothetical protein [Verrucomicrobiae bacterium]
MKKLPVIIIAGICLLCSGRVWAGDFDGSKPLICSVIQTVACPRDDEISKGTAEDVNLPQFFFIDFDKKLVTGKTAEGEVRETKIESIKHEDGKLILQGVQRGKAWSAVISEQTGRTTLVGANEEAGFVIFAACTPR